MTEEHARQDVWVKTMLGVVVGMLVILLVFGAAMILGALALRNATAAVNDATEILNRRSVVLDTVDCFISEQAEFSDAIGDLVRLGRSGTPAEYAAIDQRLDRSGSQMKACAPTEEQRQQAQTQVRKARQALREISPYTDPQGTTP